MAAQNGRTDGRTCCNLYSLVTNTCKKIKVSWLVQNLQWKMDGRTRRKLNLFIRTTECTTNRRHRGLRAGTQSLRVAVDGDHVTDSRGAREPGSGAGDAQRGAHIERQCERRLNGQQRRRRGYTSPARQHEHQQQNSRRVDKHHNSSKTNIAEN